MAISQILTQTAEVASWFFTAQGSSVIAGLGSEGRRHQGSHSVPQFPEKLSTVKNRTAHNCFFNLDFANAVWIDGQNVL